MSVRTNTLMVVKWGADLMASATTATEAACPHRATVYREDALSKIKSIRAELDELEAELTAQVTPTARAA